MAHMFNTDFGIAHDYFSVVGIPKVPWLTSSAVVLFTTVLVHVWLHVGFTFIVFPSAFLTMPAEVLDAAAVDGATG